jgi:ribosomal protein S18 acetylase RimI-like enzyme
VIVGERDGVLLRHATEADLPAIDTLTTVGYAPIQESFVSMLGADLYEAVQADPEQTWEQRKCAQNRRLFAEHPEQLWVLEDTGWVFGYVSFWLFPERSYGHLDNSAVDPTCRGEGWARFMYVHVLEHFRSLGLRYAHVATGLDDAHTAARAAYEAVGFDRSVPTVDLWRRL